MPYPILLDLTARRIVIVGGGPVAARKAAGVLAAGATDVTAVAPAFAADFPTAVNRVGRPYDPADLDGADLVFAATDSAAVNDAVVRDARARRAWASHAGDGPAGDFVTPAVFARGPVGVTVSAGSAALAVLVRDGLADRFDPAWARMAEVIADWRPRLKVTLPEADRRAVFRDLATAEACGVLAAGGPDPLWAWLRSRHPGLPSDQPDRRPAKRGCRGPTLMPTPRQLALLAAAVALFAVGGGLSVARVWWPSRPLRVTGKSCLYWGLAAAVAVLVWHSASRRQWVPVGDNFDALVWLAVLLAAFTAYVQGTRPLAALDWFLMPIVIALLVGAAVLGRTNYQPYVGQAGRWVHHVTSYGGAAAFAVAAAAGGMYVWASGRLRQHRFVGGYLGSLERLERLTMTAVTLGFALLTVGIVTGIVEMVRLGRPTPAWKVGLGVSVWVVYAVVLHAPINPVFRGRRAAVLSVVGFVLMAGAVAAAQLAGGTR